MTKAERDLFDEKVRGIYAAIEANATVQNQNFEYQKELIEKILQQTTKTNGRVTGLEEKIHIIELNEKEHINKCPQAPRIKKLEENMLEYNFIKKHPKIFVWGAICVIGGGFLFFLMKIVTMIPQIAAVFTG